MTSEVAECSDPSSNPMQGTISFSLLLFAINKAYGVFGTTGQVVPTSGQVVETTCECSAVSTTDFYQLGGSVQLQLLNDSCSAKYYPYHEIQH